MQLKSAIVAALLGVSSVVEASTIPARAVGNFGNNFKGGNGGNTNTNTNNANANTNNNANANTANTGNNNNNNANALDPSVIQTGSNQNGQIGTVEAGQVPSLTDAHNFINFCAGKTLTNGTQNVAGSCNPIVMGEIPAKTKMVSSILTFPAHNGNIAANTEFNITLKIQNIQTGFFTNAQLTYFSAPQQVNQQGLVIGHTHVTVQDLGKSLNPGAPLDATQFAFFKGINNAADANGVLTATVTGGLPAGNYRVCTMAGASNHQPVIMPVAQRGAQDDCNKFTVSANGGGANANTGNANTGNANANTGNANANTGTANANTGKATGGGKANTGNANANTGNTGNTGKNSGSNSNNNNSGNSNTNQSNGNQNGSAANATSTTTGSTGQGGTGGSAANAIGGIAAPAVANSGDSTRPFSVNGNTFVNKAAAVQRACSIQNNACADAVNSGSVKGFTVADCNKQESTCQTQLS